MIPDDIQLTTRPIAHLPLVREIVDRIGILDIIDERCPKHSLNRVSDAQCVLALITNVLAGRPALCREVAGVFHQVANREVAQDVVCAGLVDVFERTADSCDALSGVRRNSGAPQGCGAVQQLQGSLMTPSAAEKEEDLTKVEWYSEG